jgi:hypothetical protein
MPTQGEIKLGIFNAALSELGDWSIADTGETVPHARVLVARWSRVVADCVSDGSWNFATETVKLDADTGVTPGFGYTEVFAKPSDWVRTIGISQDENFVYPLLRYYDDANYLSADVSPIYLRYVSNDTGMGLELTRWTPAFTRYVELELAVRSCMKLTQNRSLKEDLSGERDKERKKAKNQDAMNEPQPKFPPPSSWTAARWGRGGGNRDRGSSGSLTG